MTLSKSKTGGWAFLENLTSSDLNDLNNGIEGALDKRSGHSDTLASDITLTGSIEGGDINGTSLATCDLTECVLVDCDVEIAGVPVAMLASAQTVELSSFVSTTSATLVSATGLLITLSNCRVGDILMIDGSYHASAGAGSSCSIRHRINDGGGNIDNALGSKTQILENAADSTIGVHKAVSFSYTVTVGGTVTIQTRISSDVSVGLVGLLGSGDTTSSLRVAHYRV